jgi:hypothetical protein
VLPAVIGFGIDPVSDANSEDTVLVTFFENVKLLFRRELLSESDSRNLITPG